MVLIYKYCYFEIICLGFFSCFDIVPTGTEEENAAENVQQVVRYISAANP